MSQQEKKNAFRELVRAAVDICDDNLLAINGIGGTDEDERNDGKDALSAIVGHSSAITLLKRAFNHTDIKITYASSADDSQGAIEVDYTKITDTQLTRAKAYLTGIKIARDVKATMGEGATGEERVNAMKYAAEELGISKSLVVVGSTVSGRGRGAN